MTIKQSKSSNYALIVWSFFVQLLHSYIITDGKMLKNCLKFLSRFPIRLGIPISSAALL